MAWANIPLWQQQELQKLSAENMLSGVDPQILGAIDLAESHGIGGSVNSSGYGGYFGTSSSTDTQTGTSAFDAQAVSAAGTFARMLEQFNNDPLAAENAYQLGPNAGVDYYHYQGEGAQVFESLGLTTTQPSPSPFLVDPSQAATLTSQTNGTPSSTKIASLGPFDLTTPYGFISRAVLVLVGIFLLYLGAKELFNSDHGATDTVVIGTRNARQGAAKRAGKVKDAFTASEVAA